MILVHSIPTFDDRYQWVFWHHSDESRVGLVDPVDVDAILDWLENGPLASGQCPMQTRVIETVVLTKIGPLFEPAIDQLKQRFTTLRLETGSNPQINVFGATVHVINKADGAKAYWFKNDAKVFVGATLSSMGFELVVKERASEQWEWIVAIRNLPEFTLLYCAQENTQSNSEFALSIEPNNRLLQQRVEEVQLMRLTRKSTLPTTIGLERVTNPFFRADEKSLVDSLVKYVAGRPGLSAHSSSAVLVQLQTLRELFYG